MTSTTDTFPRQYARTRRFSLGEPRSFRPSPDGTRIAFLRSNGGSDTLTCLWVAERNVASKFWSERVVFDPRQISGGVDGDLPAPERARRERLREQAEGVTSFDTDAEVTAAAFTVGGHVVVASLIGGDVRVLATAPGAYDPRVAPNGTAIAYVASGALHVVSADGTDDDRCLISDPSDSVTWGVADFNAAEEFNRQRGFWWSPDSTSILAARVDNSPVRCWYIADPANPGREPVVHRYPAAGTDNAVVSLAVLARDGNGRVDVTFEHSHPYLLDVQWTERGLLATWLDRAQISQQVHSVDPITGRATLRSELSDPVWIELVQGSPALLADGSLLTTIDTPSSPDEPSGTTSLAMVEVGVVRRCSPPNLQIRKVVCATATAATVCVGLAEPVAGLDADADPSQQHVVRIDLPNGDLHLIAGGRADPGVHDAVGSDSVLVVRSASLDRVRAEHRVFVDGTEEHRVLTNAEIALVEPRPVFFRATQRRIPTCVLLPSDPVLRDTKLPVLLDPYGGPHAQRVVASRNAHTTSQWFADQGFAVVVIDGSGTPGIGPTFEREVRFDFATQVLDDQVAALADAADRFPQLDLHRVAIRGWSFGGYLAALAVLKRPDVFHAAVAGAPVTEWRLYDTGYTERYLGHPDEHPRAYEASSLVPLASQLTRPLLLIHGLADDNVVAAHTLQLSSALLAAGRPHEVLPLSGVTHMTPQEQVAENMLLLQVDFIRRSLGIDR